MDDNVLNMDDSEYDTSDLELPSAGDIFSSSREHIGNENDDSSEADSSIESDDLSESFVHPDENTKILTCDHEVRTEQLPVWIKTRNIYLNFFESKFLVLRRVRTYSWSRDYG